MATASPPSTTPRLMRRGLVDGKVSLLNFKYHVGRYLTGQSVELVSHDGLIEIFHDGALIATHARLHLPGQEERVQHRALAAAPQRPATDHVVIRKVDHNGSVSFAGGDYRADWFWPPECWGACAEPTGWWPPPSTIGV